MDVYYDDGCSFCKRAMRIARRLDIFHRLRFLPVSAQLGKAGPLLHIPAQDLLYDIHGIDDKGRIKRGIAVYQSALRAMIWLAPLGWLLMIPGISHLGVAIYRRIADNRYGSSCAVDPEEISRGS